MKTIITTICILISSIGFSQEVFILDHNKNQINEKPVNHDKVKDYLKDFPNGRYYTVDVKAVKRDGNYYFLQCEYLKTELKLESI